MVIKHFVLTKNSLTMECLLRLRMSSSPAHTGALVVGDCHFGAWNRAGNLSSTLFAQSYLNNCYINSSFNLITYLKMTITGHNGTSVRQVLGLRLRRSCEPGLSRLVFISWQCHCRWSSAYNFVRAKKIQ